MTFRKDCIHAATQASLHQSGGIAAIVWLGRIDPDNLCQRSTCLGYRSRSRQSVLSSVAFSPALFSTTVNLSAAPQPPVSVTYVDTTSTWNSHAIFQLYSVMTSIRSFAVISATLSRSDGLIHILTSDLMACCNDALVISPSPRVYASKG